MTRRADVERIGRLHETAFERGTVAGTSRWTAILTIVTTPPTSADTLRRNPLGIYVDAIDWSRELEPQAMQSLPDAGRASEPTEDPTADAERLPEITGG